MNTKEKIVFKHGNLNIAGEIHFPEDFDSTKKYSSIVAVHPGNGVKEQFSGLYAALLAKQGFVALAYDSSLPVSCAGLPPY